MDEVQHSSLAVERSLVAPATLRSDRSAVSWGAIVAGGVGAAAFSLILLALGAGLGLSALSFWPPHANSAKAFGAAAVIWVCVTQILTSGLGGYLAGRLRARWGAVHIDEIHFRDTAHGFLAWALATLLGAAVTTSVLSGIGRAGVEAISAAAPQTAVATLAMTGTGPGTSHLRGDADAAGNVWPLGYYVDAVLRVPADATNAPPPPMAGTRMEITRIFMNAAATRAPLADEDAAYVAGLVSRYTGLPQAQAVTRVRSNYGGLLEKLSALDMAERSQAEAARKASVYASLWLFVALLMGAFSASLLATVGGRARELGSPL